MNPFISVILPVYNAGDYLSLAIESILNQTFNDFELIIINDGSTDNSEQIINSYQDSRIRYIKNESNSGLIFSLNKAVSLARGTYIARMDNDDISDEKRFETQLRYFRTNPNADMVCSPIMGITSTGKTRDVWPEDFNTKTAEQIRKMLPWQNCISHPTILIKTALLKKYGYSNNQKGSEDWDLWLRLVRDGKIIIKTDEILLRYRIHNTSMTRIHNRSQSAQVKGTIVKLKFFWASMMSLRVNAFALKTLLTIYRDLGYHIKTKFVPLFLRQVKWLFTINVFGASAQFRSLKTILRAEESRFFLFFPYSHIGGAEKVHAQITKALSDQSPFVFITGLDNKESFIEQFGDEARLLEIEKCLYHPFFSRRTKKLIFLKITNTLNPLVFGCNNRFFYELIAELSRGIFVADLVHDYDYDKDKTFAENNLPNYLRCNQRIFISNSAIEKTKAFYDKNFIDDEYYDRLKLIYNGVVDPMVVLKKEWKTPFTIMYVGRDTAEKRVDLIFRLAQRCQADNLPFNFVLVGPIAAREQFMQLKNLTRIGTVRDNAFLTELYNKAHFVIISSESEGFPMTLIEGMLVGCIPISTSVGDIPFHIKNGVNGFLTSNNTFDEALSEFLEILKLILIKDRALAEISERAMIYVNDKFSLKKFETSYRELFGL